MCVAGVAVYDAVVCVAVCVAGCVARWCCVCVARAAGCVAVCVAGCVAVGAEQRAAGALQYVLQDVLQRVQHRVLQGELHYVAVCSSVL